MIKGKQTKGNVEDMWLTEEIEAIVTIKKKPVDFVVTGETLLEMKQANLSYLIEGLLPKTGVVALVGSSDTGKSSFLRQLATAIVRREKDFLGFPITADHHGVIYVSTEDDSQAMAYLLNKQKTAMQKAAGLRDLRMIFETDNILSKLERALQAKRADCVMIDTFSDLYGGELNAANKVRSFINDFSNIAKKYNCLLLFLHHTGKRTEAYPPSKDNIVGSMGFEAKMRLVLELRKDYADNRKRHLCIVKGNYIPDTEKSSSYVLLFDDSMLYTRTTQRVSFDLLAKPDSRKDEKTDLKAKAISLKQKGYSIEKIWAQLTNEGFTGVRSTVGNWVRTHPTIQSSIEEMDGDETEATEKDHEDPSIQPEH